MTSPQLTTVSRLSHRQNTNRVSLADLIGSEHLTEMWQFNYIVDVAFTLGNLHPNISRRVKCSFIIHDKTGETTRNIQRTAERLGVGNNVQVASPRIPSRFGTQHAKLMVLFFKENNVLTAKVIIHTAVLTSVDWDEMCEGVWCSSKAEKKAAPTVQSGHFESYLLDFLRTYDMPTTRCLAARFALYDWSRETVSLIGSVPGSHVDDKWGLNRAARLLQDHKDSHPSDYNESQHDTVVLQASSIASFPASDTWLTPQLVAALDGRHPGVARHGTLPRYNIVWPTVQNTLQSFNPPVSQLYLKCSGRSLKKQYHYMESHMRVWTASNKGLDRVMPHIKTYARVTKTGDVRWLIMTSANLSKQAWGVVSKRGLAIDSWELGVVIFPQVSGKSHFHFDDTILPYDWPTSPYSRQDIPWSS